MHQIQITLSYHPLCFDMVFLIVLFLMQLFQLRLIQWLLLREAAPKINNLRIFGKKSISSKFKASIMPSGGSSKAKPVLPLTLFLIFDATCISSFTLFNILSKKLYHRFNLNENVLRHLSFRCDIFLIKSS